MAEKFRTSAETINIEVNDAGDIIQLPLSDEAFIKRFYDFTNAIQQKGDELSEEKLSGMEDSEKIILDINYHEFLKAEFEKLFGEKSYEKVFGDNVLVSVEYVMEFIEACMPYITQHTQKRIEKFSKYSANRQGSSL